MEKLREYSGLLDKKWYKLKQEFRFFLVFTAIYWWNKTILQKKLRCKWWETLSPWIPSLLRTTKDDFYSFCKFFGFSEWSHAGTSNSEYENLSFTELLVKIWKQEKLKNQQKVAASDCFKNDYEIWRRMEI